MDGRCPEQEIWTVNGSRLQGELAIKWLNSPRLFENRGRRDFSARIGVNVDGGTIRPTAWSMGRRWACRPRFRIFRH